MSLRSHNGKSSNRGGGGSSHGGRDGGPKIDKGNFDELMVGFIIMTDQNREKNCVTDANNFLIPIIEELFPNAYERMNTEPQEILGGKKLKVNYEEQEQKQEEEEQSTQNIKQEVQVKTEIEGIPHPCPTSSEQPKIEKKEEDSCDSENTHNPTTTTTLANLKVEYQNDEGQQQQQQIQTKEEHEQDQHVLPKIEEPTEDMQPIKSECQAEEKNMLSSMIEARIPTQTMNDRLERELMDLKSQKDKLLFNVNTDVKCTVFLKVNSKLMHNIDVYEVVEKVMQRVHVERTSLTRFCHRMFPAEYAFRASEENLKKYLPMLIQKRFNSDAPSSWMLEIKSRNNNKFNRKNVLDIVSELVPKHHFVDYKNPFYTIVVDVCHNLMCLSILKNYVDYKKYSVKVNPQLNNNKDFHPPIPLGKSQQNHKHHQSSTVAPITEEEKKAQEQRQEEQRAQLRSEFLAGTHQATNQGEEDDEEIDLI